MDGLIRHASLVHAALLLAGFVAALLWERRRPLRAMQARDDVRTTANIGLLVTGEAVAHLIVPAGAALAAWAAAHLHRGVLVDAGLPLPVEIVIAIVALDALDWSMHRAMHRVGWLWRIHRVHHSDLDYDASLAFRFHPLEIALRALPAAALAAVLGLSPAALLAAGLVATLHNVLVHVNASLPPRLERWLRPLVVTPDWHRMHHSADVAESMSNFGTVLPWWDRLAGTASTPGLVARLGVDDLRERDRLGLRSLLALPFARPARVPASHAADLR